MALDKAKTSRAYTITAGKEKPVSHGTVSIVIPARNAATTLVACLQSIHQLDPAPLEVIVVDDASMDDTAEVAERYGARVIRAKSNLGPGGARNLGVRHAQGEYLAFTDSDCRVPTDWLGNLQNAFASGGYCGVSGPYMVPSMTRRCCG